MHSAARAHPTKNMGPPRTPVPQMKINAFQLWNASNKRYLCHKSRTPFFITFNFLDETSHEKFTIIGRLYGLEISYITLGANYPIPFLGS
jgi:hypothetical protein